MAAVTGLISKKYSLFHSFKFIPRVRIGLDSATTTILTNKVFNSKRTVSTSPYLIKDRDESSFTNGSSENEKQIEKEKRVDLENLKKLLLQKKLRKSDKNIPSEPQAKQNKTKTRDGIPVNVSQIQDMLASLSQRGTDHSPEDRRKIPKPTEEKPTSETSLNVMANVTSTQPVKAEKFRDALSALGQDSSSAEEVIIMAGRQISSDNRSAIEGAYNIKQRQFRDKDKRKRMARSSLKTGPRSHMFDNVREKWSHNYDFSEQSIFGEMAKQAVKDLGMSATVQSGFHDLMDNVNRQWAFPVDNEICKTVEEGVGFDEHVFLEHHLADFPKTGNIREFMELVVTGLQQNPHLTVEEKNEHIEWFRDYFQNIPDEQVQL